MVLGAGPIGLLTLQWALSAGAETVIVVEPEAGRRRLAEQLGAAVTVAPDDTSELVNERTGGLGAG